MSPLQIADAVGIFVFALSGGLAASRRGLDVFGILVVSLLPAIGGGTIRDLLLDRPVFWLEQSNTILIALGDFIRYRSRQYLILIALFDDGEHTGTELLMFHS